MLAVLMNLLLALIGFLVGYFFFERHKQSMLVLLRTVRLVLDYDYFLKTYQKIAHGADYEAAGRIYDLPERAEHTETLRGGETKTYRSICYEKLEATKQLLKQLSLTALAPLILAALIGKLPLVASSILLAIAVLLTFECFRAAGTGITARKRRESILQHAYAVQGRRLQRISRSTLPPTSQALVTSFAWPKPALLRAGAPDISPKNFKEHFGALLSWQNAWWGADIAVSVLLVAQYWWGNALSDGVLHLILLTLAIVCFVQLFFVPMWFTIRLCQRLIAAEHPRHTSLHRF